MSTYGDYSHKAIKRVVCKTCFGPVKEYNLQRLLDDTGCLCTKCSPIKPVVVTSSVNPSGLKKLLKVVLKGKPTKQTKTGKKKISKKKQ